MYDSLELLKILGEDLGHCYIVEIMHIDYAEIHMKQTETYVDSLFANMFVCSHNDQNCIYCHNQETKLCHKKTTKALSRLCSTKKQPQRLSTRPVLLRPTNSHATKKYWQRRNSTQVFSSSGELAIFFLADCKSSALIIFEVQDTVLLAFKKAIIFNGNRKSNKEPRSLRILMDSAVKSVCLDCKYLSVDTRICFVDTALCLNHFKTFCNVMLLEMQHSLIALYWFSHLSIGSVSFDPCINKDHGNDHKYIANCFTNFRHQTCQEILCTTALNWCLQTSLGSVLFGQRSNENQENYLVAINLYHQITVELVVLIDKSNGKDQENPQENNENVANNENNPTKNKSIETDENCYETTEYTIEEAATNINKLLSPPSGDICREIFRLSTFATFPRDVHINLSQYAQAGFYYVGTGDTIKCFACDNINQNLTQQMDPFLLRMHKSSCRFTRREDNCGNIPIHPAPTVQTPPSRQLSAGELLMGSSLTNSVSNPVSNEILRTPSMSVQNAVHRHQPHVPALPVMRHLANIVDPEHERLLRRLDLRRESDRLRTFTSSWPRDTLPSARRMSSAGWFYLGNLDRTQCFSCGGVLRNWRRMDNPAVEHVTHFPHCAMAQSREQLNIPEGPEGEPQPIRVRPLTAEERVGLQEMFPCNYPSSSQMAVLASRIATFQNWLYTRATPRMLAEAGFYSLGVRDRVKCHYCNGGLQNWRRNDDPWEQHAKWYPTCEFLLQNRGVEYVHEVVAQFPELDRPILRSSGLDVAPSVMTRNQQQSSSNASETRTPLEEAMTSEIATTIIGMGFERDVVRQVMRRHIERHGGPYTSAERLLEDVANFVESPEEEQEESSVLPPPQEPTAGVSSIQIENSDDEDIYRSSAEENRIEDVDTHDSVPSVRFFEPADLNDQNHENERNESPEQMEDNEEAESEMLRRRLDELTSERLCKVCLDRPADMVFIPCKHMCCCMECTRALRVCPICRVRIERGIRTYAK